MSRLLIAPEHTDNEVDREKLLEKLELKLEELKKEKHKLFMSLKHILSDEERRKQQEEALERKRYFNLSVSLIVSRAEEQHHRMLEQNNSSFPVSPSHNNGTSMPVMDKDLLAQTLQQLPAMNFPMV